MTLDDKINSLVGPVLVLGAGGFIGANLFRRIAACRNDVYGTINSKDVNWRLEDFNPHFKEVLGHGNHLWASDNPCQYHRHKTVFNCIAYGGYPHQTDTDRIYATNFDLTRRIVEGLAKSNVAAYVHAGSSSEYGTNSDGPREDSPCAPNSHYAVSKLAATQYLQYMGTQGFPCAVLRLASVYGPWEDPGRLIPKVVEHGLRGEFPPFVDASITRDFVYVDDVVEAFVDAALLIDHIKDCCCADYGEVFNIGRGVATPIGRLAEFAGEVFSINRTPEFTLPKRDWDHGAEWRLDVDKAKSVLKWQAKVNIPDGLTKTAEWAKTRQ